MANIKPQGVATAVEAEHLGMSIRGVREPGENTVTSFMMGIISRDARTRVEYFPIIKS